MEEKKEPVDIIIVIEHISKVIFFGEKRLGWLLEHLGYEKELCNKFDGWWNICISHIEKGHKIGFIENVDYKGLRDLNTDELLIKGETNDVLFFTNILTIMCEEKEKIEEARSKPMKPETKPPLPEKLINISKSAIPICSIDGRKLYLEGCRITKEDAIKIVKKLAQMFYLQFEGKFV